MALGKAFSRLLLVKSFIFGALVLGVWVRSYFVSDMVTVTLGAKSSSLAAAEGLIIYRAAADGEDSVRLEQMSRHYSSDDPAKVIASQLLGQEMQFGFSYSKHSMYQSGRGLVLTITIPCWLFFILGSSKALFWLARRGINHATAPPLRYAWCAYCQCEQPADAAQCKRCGSAVAA